MMPGGPSGTNHPRWTAAELATLAELAETFVRGGAVRRADLFEQALEGAADPAQVRQLRLVLRLVESRLVNLVLAGTPRPFRDLSPPARERYLVGWADSRLALRRTAFHGLRKLLTFLAYADPGDGVPNPLLAAIGYRPDDPPPTSSPTPIVPLAVEPDGQARSAGLELDADVVVVGSGAGGGVVARDLARAGRSVVVVEAGPFVDETTMPRDELDAYDRLYLNHGLTDTWDGAVTMLAGGAVGGGTLVNWMTCIDSPPDVRADWATGHGIAGWDAPSAEADVLDLERELGVAVTSEVGPKDEAILRGAAALGWDAEPTRRNASSCVDCGSCPFGCRRGAKQSGIRGHLAEAFAAGARIVAQAEVERVLVAAGRASGVEALVRPDGAAGAPAHRLRVHARQVVVAAGALRTPAVLERSGIDHPALGRHLRLHPVPVVAARFAEPIDMWRGTMQGARCAQFLRPEAGRSTYIVESAPGHPGLLALSFPWRGTDQHAGLVGGARNWAPLIAVTRDGGEGRVSLTRAGRVRVDYALDALGVATLRHAVGSMARIARAAGAREIIALGTRPRAFGSGGHAPGESDRSFGVYLDALAAFDFRPNRGTVFSAHQMGTARMGEDARTHACDPHGRVRAGSGGHRIVGGLFVADASLFPTAVGVNPMITVMALARRVGRAVLAEG